MVKNYSSMNSHVAAKFIGCSMAVFQITISK